MSVALDNTFLTLFLNPKSDARPNPATGKPTLYVRERIEDLIDDLSERRQKLIIPSPCLAEVLTGLKEPNKVLEILSGQRCIEIYPFDQKCAVELAYLVRRYKDKVKAVQADGGPTWQNIKMDLQIIAIAKVYGANSLCTDDTTQGSFATLCGLKVQRTWDLPLSDARAQVVMNYESRS